MIAVDRKQWLVDNLPTSDRIRLVFCQVAEDEEDLKQFNQEHVADGYEGSIARPPNSKYENKRSKGLIKIKQFITEEFVLEDIVEGTGNRSGMAGAIIFHIGDVEVKAGIRGSWQYAKAILAQKADLIGKLATVRHFGATPDGSLRFPICIDINRPD